MGATRTRRSAFRMDAARTIAAVLCATVLLLTAGCGTLTGVVSGPVMGGSSLTVRLYGSDAPTGAKVVATPFTFAAGTVIGVLPACAKGIEKDDHQDYSVEDFLEILDPFEAGMFRSTE